MSFRILLVEDEPGLVLTLSDLLSAEGYEVETAADGPSGFSMARDATFDVIVLDVMLPGRNGFDLCKDLRQSGCDAAILMLTARTQVIDRVVGLKLGADDYLTKPFELRELEARIHVLHRRKQREACVNLRVADLVLDFGARSAVRQNRMLSLSPSGYRLLEALMRNTPNVMRYAELAHAVWGDTEHDPARLHTLVSNVRCVVDRPFDRPLIHTVHSFGYRLAPGFDA